MSSIIESMSSRKLTYLVLVLALCQLGCFFLGALVSPPPNAANNILATKCVDPAGDTKSEAWFYLRGEGGCKRIESFSDPEAQKMQLTAENIVFSFQMPVHSKVEYTRWQQSLMGILNLDIAYQSGVDQDPTIKLFMLARLGYRNKGDPDGAWKEIDSSFVHRNLDCTIDEERKREGYYYDCSILNMFDLGSLHHDYYLLNVRLPSIYEEDGTVIDVNEGVGKLVDVHLTAIHQNGGFTKVWLALKTVFFPVIIAEMVWFWRRISMLPRESTLIEKALFALGAALTFLNLPMEWLTLGFDMPWLTLFNDIKQGVFYATLMTFWIIFAGEHCINEGGATGEKRGLAAYGRRLASVLLGCTCLFFYDVCERGVQLSNPFYSIWATELGSNLALGFIILAGLSAGVFFLFLCYLIYRVLMTITEKQAAISAMSQVRRLHYQGIIWRFRFLLLATLVTAAMTTIGFILGQVSEGQYKWDEDIALEYTAGFMTGVYGMWNIYIFGLIFLYAPSHKNWVSGSSSNDDGDGQSQNGEEIEFSLQRGAGADASELSSLTEFIRHQATD